MPHLTLFGGALLENRSGAPVDRISRRYPLALLSLLATAPSRTLSRGKLVGLMWPEVPEDTARNRLSNYVHDVRNELGPEALVSVGDDLRLDRDALECDVWRYEAALERGDRRSAVTLYRGPFLDGFRLKGAPAFEQQVERLRAGLRRRYRRALEALAEEAGDRGEPGEAADWWRERVDDDPYDGRVVRRLVQALAAAGNPTAAARTADTHSRLVEEQLGIPPDPEIRELVAGLGQDVERGGAGLTPSRQQESSGAGLDVPPPADPGGGSPSASPPRPSSGAGRRRAGRRRWAVGIAASLALVLAAGGAYVAGLSAKETPGQAGEVSIAVLPFEAIGDAPPPLVDEGLHASVVAALSELPGVGVVPRGSVRDVADGPSSARLARELGVGWVLEGTVQASGSDVQVTAQLVESATDRYAWSATYRRELQAGGLLDLQRDLTRRIAGALETRLARE